MGCPHSPKLKIMIPADSVLLSAKFASVCAVPCLFWFGPEEWPTSERESSCIVGHIDGINNTNIFVLQISSDDVIIHRHEGDYSFDLFWCTLHFTHHSLDLGENLQRGESWEIFQLEFHWFSIDSIQFSVLVGKMNHLRSLSRSTLDCGKGLYRSKTQYRIWEYMDCCRSNSWFLRHSIKIVFPVEKFANKFVTPPRFLLLALESVFVTPRTISLQWVFILYFWWKCKFCPRSLSEGKRLQSWLKTQTFPKSTNACRDLPFYHQDGDSSLFAIWCVLFPWVELIRQKSRILAVSPIQFRWPNPLQPVSPCQLSIFPLSASLESSRSVTFVWNLWQRGFLRTGSDGFPRTSCQTQPMTVSSETPWACRCSRTWRCWRPCHASRYQIHHRFWFGGKSFFTISLLHPIRHRLRAAWRAENVDFQQKEKMIPFITCEISLWSESLRVGFWCRHIWFGSLGSTLILSNNQSRATLWVLETCLIVRLLLLTILFITASLSSKMYNIAPLWEEFAFEETKSTFDNSWFSLEAGVLFWELLRVSDVLFMQRVSPYQLISECLIRFWM